MKPMNVNALPDGSGVIIKRQVQVVELGADSKRLLAEIRDRLPATAPPPAPAEYWMDWFTLWEILVPKEKGWLVAWLSPDNQIAWVERGSKPTMKGCRMLYVGKGES